LLLYLRTFVTNERTSHLKFGDLAQSLFLMGYTPPTENLCTFISWKLNKPTARWINS